MKIRKDISHRIEQVQLQGYDFVMLQNIYLLPGNLLDRYIRDYALDNPAIRVKQDNYGIGGEIEKVEWKKSLYCHLVDQIEVSFKEEEKKEAKEIAGNLDRNGFYHGEESDVLRKMQYLDPLGIGSRSSKEAMIVQLKDVGRGDSVACKVLENYYEYFLYKNRSDISRRMGISEEEIEKAFEELVLLNPFPGRKFSDSSIQYIFPEMKIEYKKKWQLSFVKDFYPSVELIKQGTSKQINDAYRFIYQLNNRKNRLEKIVSKIVKAHHDYLLGEGEMGLLLRKKVLEELDISESTFSRILSDKYIETPIGVFSLGYFFSKKERGIQKDVSVEKAKKILLEIIEKENVKAPYPDRILKELLEKKGIKCSRRRIAKYRKSLLIPGVYHRASK